MEQAFAYIVQNSPEAIAILDRDWKYRYVNYKAEILLRQKSDALAGHSLWRVFPELLDTPAEAALKKAVEKRISVRFEQFLPRLYAWHSVRALPIDDGVVLYSIDITDRMRDAHSEAVKAEIRNILENAPLAIRITRGKEHRIETVNARARQLFHHRRVEGLTMRAALPELEEQGYVEILDEVFATGKPFEGNEMPVRFYREDSEEMIEGLFNIIHQPLFDVSGHVTGIMSMATNITQRVIDRTTLAELTAERDRLLAALQAGGTGNQSGGEDRPGHS
jgi:PAS domain S-box-containing protein